MACQKVMSGNPNNVGANQFHKSITTSPPIAVKIAIPRIASGAIIISLVSLVRSVSLFLIFRFLTYS